MCFGPQDITAYRPYPFTFLRSGVAAAFRSRSTGHPPRRAAAIIWSAGTCPRFLPAAEQLSFLFSFPPPANIALPRCLAGGKNTAPPKGESGSATGESCDKSQHSKLAPPQTVLLGLSFLLSRAQFVVYAARVHRRRLWRLERTRAAYATDCGFAAPFNRDPLGSAFELRLNRAIEKRSPEGRG